MYVYIYIVFLVSGYSFLLGPSSGRAAGFLPPRLDYVNFSLRVYLNSRAAVVLHNCVTILIFIELFIYFIRVF